MLFAAEFRDSERQEHAPTEADAFNLCSRQLIPEMVDFQSPLRASAIWWPHQQTLFSPQYPTQS